MNDIEKRARELIKTECPGIRDEAFEYGSMMTVVNIHAVMNALRAALTQTEDSVPVSAVLATATRLRRLASAASPLGRKAYIKAAEGIEMTVSAARPEVSP